MLCWVRPHEKKELKKAVNEQFPLVFAKNYDDFKAQIREGDYLVFSCGKAKTHFRKIASLVQTHFSNVFVMYDRKEDEDFTLRAGDLWWNQNVISGFYTANEIKDNYLGNIPDLPKYRHSLIS